MNYIAFFLTFKCQLNCNYCINKFLNKKLYSSEIIPEKWIKFANNLELKNNVPITLQGGEPTLYKGFYKIVNDVKKTIKMDLLTNMQFDVNDFIKNVPVYRFQRKAKYASIRVSYHPFQNEIDEIIYKIKKLEERGFRVGIYSVLFPDEKIKEHLFNIEKKCKKNKIDFRFKEYLGYYKKKLYGNYKYKNAIDSNPKECECRINELLVSPAGKIYKCHSDLYNNRESIFDMDNVDLNDIYKFRKCNYYGLCNPCDVKIKTNKNQEFGYTSVEIRNINE